MIALEFYVMFLLETMIFFMGHLQVIPRRKRNNNKVFPQLKVDNLNPRRKKWEKKNSIHFVTDFLKIYRYSTHIGSLVISSVVDVISATHNSAIVKKNRVRSCWQSLRLQEWQESSPTFVCFFGIPLEPSCLSFPLYPFTLFPLHLIFISYILSWFCKRTFHFINKSIVRIFFFFRHFLLLRGTGWIFKKKKEKKNRG